MKRNFFFFFAVELAFFFFAYFFLLLRSSRVFSPKRISRCPRLLLFGVSRPVSLQPGRLSLSFFQPHENFFLPAAAIESGPFPFTFMQRGESALAKIPSISIPFLDLSLSIPQQMILPLGPCILITENSPRQSRTLVFTPPLFFFFFFNCIRSLKSPLYID